MQVPNERVKGLDGLAKIDTVEFWRDNAGLGAAWFLDKLVVENRSNNRSYVFPMFRWVRPNWHYLIKHLDTALPQNDSHKDQRLKELQEKRKTYKFFEKEPGLPAQVRLF